jgi:hypothetical protein
MQVAPDRDDPAGLGSRRGKQFGWVQHGNIILLFS